MIGRGWLAGWLAGGIPLNMLEGPFLVCKHTAAWTLAGWLAWGQRCSESEAASHYRGAMLQYTRAPAAPFYSTPCHAMRLIACCCTGADTGASGWSDYEGAHDVEEEPPSWDDLIAWAEDQSSVPPHAPRRTVRPAGTTSHARQLSAMLAGLWTDPTCLPAWLGAHTHVRSSRGGAYARLDALSPASRVDAPSRVMRCGVMVRPSLDWTGLDTLCRCAGHAHAAGVCHLATASARLAHL